MSEIKWPALAGLLFLCLAATAHSRPDFSGFSHDQAYDYSQAAIGGRVEGVTLIGSAGEPVNLEDYRGKPLVISMIFTSCHHICPSTTQHLAQVVKKARAALDADSFNVLTVGFDTLNDTPGQLASFRRAQGVNDKHWDFLGGDEANMRRLAEQLGFIYYPSTSGFEHLVQATVVDAEGGVYRQIYGISWPTPTLIEPLKQLVFGRPEPERESALSFLGKRIRLFCTVYDPATDNYYIDFSVFIGTGVGIIVSILFGWFLFREWRRAI